MPHSPVLMSSHENSITHFHPSADTFYTYFLLSFPASLCSCLPVLQTACCIRDAVSAAFCPLRSLLGIKSCTVLAFVSAAFRQLTYPDNRIWSDTKAMNSELVGRLPSGVIRKRYNVLLSSGMVLVQATSMAWRMARSTLLGVVS